MCPVMRRSQTPSQPCTCARRVTASAGHAEGDTFVPASHTRRLHAAYGGEDKDVMLFQGDHNSARPKEFYSKALTFLHCALRCDVPPLGCSDLLLPAGCAAHAALGAPAAAVCRCLRQPGVAEMCEAR